MCVSLVRSNVSKQRKLGLCLASVAGGGGSNDGCGWGAVLLLGLMADDPENGYDGDVSAGNTKSE